MRLKGNNRIAGMAPSAHTPKHSPERPCVGCHQKRPRNQLFRVVCDPTGQLMLDPHGKLPGRGAHLCPQRSCLEHALKGTRLREALRCDVSLCAPDELMRAIIQAMEDKVLAYIRLARKAGRVVSGYSQVNRALMSEPVACLLVAEDAACERRREYHSRSANRQIPCRSFLTKARLGELAGRDESSALGILDTRLAEQLVFFLEGMKRLVDR